MYKEPTEHTHRLALILLSFDLFFSILIDYISLWNTTTKLRTSTSKYKTEKMLEQGGFGIVCKKKPFFDYSKRVYIGHKKYKKRVIQ